MLTGRRAFEGEDVTDTLAAMLRGEPDWNALSAGRPRAVRTLLSRAASRRIAGRACPTSPSCAFCSTRRRLRCQRRYRRAPFTAARPGRMLAAALAVAAGPRARRSVADARLIVSRHLTFSILHPQGTFLVTEAQALSPDGRMLAEVRRGTQGPGFRFWLRRMDRVDWTPIRGTEGASPSVIFWSPDSRQLGFHAVAERQAETSRPGRRRAADDLRRGGWRRRADWRRHVEHRRHDRVCRIAGQAGIAHPQGQRERRRAARRRAGRRAGRDQPAVAVVPGGRPSFSVSEPGRPRASRPRFAWRRSTGARAAVWPRPTRWRSMRRRRSTCCSSGDSTLVAQRFNPRTFRLSGDPARVGEGVGVSRSSVRAISPRPRRVSWRTGRVRTATHD